MKKILATTLLCTAASSVFAFSFSEEEKQQKDAEAASRQRVVAQLATPCKQAIKDKRIMVVVGERGSKGMMADQEAYSPHFQAIDKRLKRLGLNTITQAEMKARIAQAEIEAYLRNDQEAALNASKKMGSDFILKGVISSKTAVNPLLRIPEVYVSMAFTLTGADGRTISEAGGRAESYSGTDTGHMALTLINEQAEGVVAKLYSDYCRSAGVTGKK